MEEAGSCRVPMQLSYRMVPEVQVPNTEGWGGKVCRRSNQITVRVEIGRDIGAERAGGPRPRCGKHTAEAFYIDGDGSAERQDGNKVVQELPSAQKKGSSRNSGTGGV